MLPPRPAEVLAFDGSDWEPLEPFRGGTRPLASYAAPDGTIWVGSFRKRRGGPDPIVVARLDDGVWTELEPLPAKRSELYLLGTDRDGAVWAYSDLRISRYEGDRWVETSMALKDMPDEIDRLMALAGLKDDAGRPGVFAFGYPGGPEAPAAYAPGVVWFAASPDEVPRKRVERLAMPRAGCDGVVRFDGVESERQLAGLCVYDLALASDGSVWLLANEWVGSRLEPEYVGPVGLYVITPEAGHGSHVS